MEIQEHPPPSSHIHRVPIQLFGLPVSSLNEYLPSLSAMSNNPQVPPDTIAIACVVDTSLALAGDWLRILLEYLHPMLKRLSEANQGSRVRILCPIELLLL